MGKRDKLSVEVKSAFCVPHSEKEDEVAVNTEFAKEMMELHQKVAKESIVGWFATGGEITGHSVLIHDFYSRLDKHVVHVTIDTTLRIGKMEIKAYIKSCIGVPGKTDGTMFTPVPCEVTYYRPERVAVQQMQETKLNEGRQTQVFSELTHLQLATTKVHHITNKLICYIEDVLSGKCRGDPQVGRLLTDMISKVPDIPPSQFEHLLNNSMQDLLMVLYLSNLTRIQLSMGEKLSLLMS